MNRPIKLFLVDDHPFFRQGVTFYLNSVDDFELVGEADSGEKALQEIPAAEPDVVLMDLQMTGIDGISAAASLLEEQENLRILMLTSFGSEDKVAQALQAGAAGYCKKDAPPDDLAAAIRAVAAGGTYLGRGISPNVLAGSPKAADHSLENVPAGFTDLTQRELDVLQLLAGGLSNKEIASQLFVGEKTIKTHVANVLQKLNVKTRTQAALLVKEYGLF